MSGARAIHLTTGDARLAEALDAWLERHQVPVARCEDAFDACAHIVGRSVDVCDLALVGLDWLPTDEFAILRYLRETWPGICLILYGRDASRCEAARRGALHIETPEEAQRLAARSPGEVIRSAHAGREGISHFPAVTGADRHDPPGAGRSVPAVVRSDGTAE